MLKWIKNLHQTDGHSNLKLVGGSVFALVLIATCVYGTINKMDNSKFDEILFVLSALICACWGLGSVDWFNTLKNKVKK